MKRSLLMLAFLMLLTGCGRTYALIGRVVCLDVPASSITEVAGKDFPPLGNPIQGAVVTLFHELHGNRPIRDTVWSTSVVTDSNGDFHLSSYATPGKENLVGLEVAMRRYETAFTIYKDYMDREQYFLVVLRKSTSSN